MTWTLGSSPRVTKKGDMLGASPRVTKKGEPLRASRRMTKEGEMPGSSQRVTVIRQRKERLNYNKIKKL